MEVHMTLREKATATATELAGECSCALMDGGADCRWCQVFYDVLQGYPVDPRPAAGSGGRLALEA
jgi:hypothetical protein